MVAVFIYGGELKFTVEKKPDILAKAGKHNPLLGRLLPPYNGGFVQGVF